MKTLCRFDNGMFISIKFPSIQIQLCPLLFLSECLPPHREYIALHGDVINAVEGLQNLGLCSELMALGQKEICICLSRSILSIVHLYNKQEELIAFLPDCSLNSYLIAWVDRPIGFIVMCFYLNGYPIYPHLCLIGHFHFEVTEHFFIFSMPNTDQ